MENVIYCFTGRGNSLKTALDLSVRLGNADIIPIRNDTVFRDDPDTKKIGIITPVIDFGLPVSVKKFIEKFKQLKNEKYVFAILTNGGMPCATMRQLENSLNKRGYKLSSSFQLKFGLDQRTSDEWQDEIEKIAQVVKQSEINSYKVNLIDKVMTMMNGSLAKWIIRLEDKKFRVDGKCNGCGICEKICPVGNINLVNEKPIWKHSCVQCSACFTWCPQEAISGTNLAAKSRYRNAGIDLNQMLSFSQPQSKCSNGS